jgi:GNAT superfamily N-acetyltransferase
MLEIKPACSEDIAELRRMAIETSVDTFGADNSPAVMEAFHEETYALDRFVLEFQEENSIYFIAWEDAVPAGFMRLRETDEVEHLLGKSTVELQRIYVIRNFLGKKVGAALITTAISYARDRRREWLWLGVWERNTSAQAFYAKWGFEQFSEHTFMMGPDPQRDVLLKLKL